MCDSSDEAALADFLDDTVRRLTEERYGPDPALPVIIQRDSARSRLRALAAIQAAERARGWRVEHVEKSFPETLDDVVIHGRIDVIERHPETGQRRVIDYKTGAKGTDPEKAHVKALRGAAAGGMPDWQRFDYGGKLSTMYKDVFLCLEEARELNVPMWVGSNVVQLWFHAMTQGRGNDDYTTLIKMIEDWAGVTVGGNESGPKS